MDLKTAKGFAFLTTMGRVTTNVPRFFAAAKATGMTVPGYLVVDEGDYAKNVVAYDALDLPENWTIHTVKGGSCAQATEEAYSDLMKHDTDYVIWLTDDLVPETTQWDQRVVEALKGWNMVSTDDGFDAPNKFNGAVAWSGDLLRAVGYLYPEGCRHFYIDTMWEEMAKLLNNWTCLMDVMVRHVHHTRNPGIADKTTDHTRSFWDIDEPAFMRWKNNEKLSAANRIGQLMLDYKVTTPLPDLNGIRLMIATPTGSGKYDRQYMGSMFQTFEILRQCGAQVNFAEIPFCSDVALARAKIFGQFVRSDSTHLLSIDDDMGWNPQDVVKLLAHKRDFVAAAGPRKVFPPSFAVQNVTDLGHPLPLTFDTAGLIEATDIGGAFTMITMACALRVRDAYPELAFAGDDGRVEYAVYNPVVVARRYKSEDFAFCHRWRAVGGKIYVDPYISLQHVGTHVWQGDWMSHLMAMPVQQDAAVAA
ncbi:MAG TPA: hypothetical protein VGN16_09450 [Acidobacteriaceae bacterium]|jgi:hypothetical protein